MDTPTLEELKTATADRYDIEGFLAQGGMGSIYTARNRTLGSRVAIKVLPAEVSTSAVRLARFKREATVAANLSHPNIVPVFEFGAAPNLAYLVMPFIEGQSLAEYVIKKRKLDYGFVRQVIVEIAHALGFAHQQEVVHRDIKPGNILREEASGRWLLADFGIAHVTSPGDTEITQTGTIIGTPAYMSPEQRWGGEIDGRSDLYSLAAVAFQALSGTPIDELPDVLSADREELARLIRQAQPKLKLAVAQALVAPLAAKREDRPGSADRWIEAIKEAEGDRKLARWAWAAAVVAVGLAAWVWLRPASGPAAPTNPVVAILPAQVTSESDQIDLATVLPQAFEAQFNYLPSYGVLGRLFRDSLTRRYGIQPAELDSMLALAQALGATEALSIRAGARGDSLSAQVLVHEILSGRVSIDTTAAGLIEDLDNLVSDLFISAFAVRQATEVAGWRPAFPSGGPRAINAYVQGMLDFRRGAYAEAVRQFTTVVGLDSAFGPAHFRRMLAQILDARPSQYVTHVREALDAAIATRAGLDPLSQRLLDGYQKLLRDGDVEGAETLVDSLVQEHPRAWEAWFVLGYFRFNFRPLLGIPPGEARVAFERALEGDPGFAIVLWHLAAIAQLEGNPTASRRRLAELLAVDSTSIYAIHARMFDSLQYQGGAARMRVLGSFAERPPGTLELIAVAAGELKAPAGSRPLSREALNTLWQTAATSSDRRLAFRMRIAAMLAEGRYEDASAFMREGAQQRVPPDELDRWVLLTAVTGLPALGDAAEQAAAAQRLAEAQENRAEALWLVARWSFERDQGAWTRSLTDLRQIARTSATTSPLARSLLLDLEAHQHLADGDSTLAKERWDEATERFSVDRIFFGLTASLWPLRLACATVRVAQGEHEGALAGTKTFLQMAGFVDQIAWPLALKLRAQSAMAAGEGLIAQEAVSDLRLIMEEPNGHGIRLLEEAEAVLTRVGG